LTYANATDKAVGNSLLQLIFFQFGVSVLANLSSCTKTLNLVLQSPKLKLSKKFLHVNDVIDDIENIRENSISRFETYFKNASDMFVSL